MQHRCTILVGVLLLSAVARVCPGQSPDEPKSFPAGIYLIGTQPRDEPETCRIDVISPDGKELRTIFRREKGWFYPGGRFSRAGDRLAFCYVGSDRKGEFSTIDSAGQTTKIADGRGMITAWSPDGQQIAYYDSDANSDSFESFVLDLPSRKQTKLELPADYMAEDWHPRDNIRTLIYMNPRNVLYRKEKGDQYPTRQLDLLTSTGRPTPLTRNPSTDNIWSRFSPSGDRIAHYGRRLEGERSLEYVVVCAADGSEPKEIFNFTEYGAAAGVPWFRPNRHPAWSPDGSTLVWHVSTNTEPSSVGAQHELLFISADGSNVRRLSLAEKGLGLVSALEWR